MFIISNRALARFYLLFCVDSNYVQVLRRKDARVDPSIQVSRSYNIFADVVGYLL